MIDHNHFICHLILGTFTEYPQLFNNDINKVSAPALGAGGRGFESRYPDG